MKVDFLRLIDVDAGGLRLKKGEGTSHPTLLSRRREIGLGMIGVLGQGPWPKSLAPVSVLLPTIQS